MPHLIELDNNRPANRLRLGRECRSERFDPILDRWDGDTNQFSGPGHRQATDIKENGRDLLRQGAAARCCICEIILAIFAAIALMTTHLTILDKPGTLTTLTDHEPIGSLSLAPLSPI